MSIPLKFDGNYTEAELIELGKQYAKRKNATYAKIYHDRIKARWEAEQYKAFAIDNEFELPEYNQKVARDFALKNGLKLPDEPITTITETEAESE